MRAESHPLGLNGRRDTVFAYWDFEADTVKELPVPDRLFVDLDGPALAQPEPRSNNPQVIEKLRLQAAARQKAQTEKAKKKGLLAPNELGAVNLPHVMLDSAGRPWLTVRYYKTFCWSLALTRFDVNTHRRRTEHRREPLLPPHRANRRKHGVEFADLGDCEVSGNGPPSLFKSKSRPEKIACPVVLSLLSVALSKSLPLNT